MKKKATVSTTDLFAATDELDSLFLVAFNIGDADAIMKLHWQNTSLKNRKTATE